MLSIGSLEGCKFTCEKQRTLSKDFQSYNVKGMASFMNMNMKSSFIPSQLVLGNHKAFCRIKSCSTYYYGIWALFIMPWGGNVIKDKLFICKNKYDWIKDAVDNSSDSSRFLPTWAESAVLYVKLKEAQEISETITSNLYVNVECQSAPYS